MTQRTTFIRTIQPGEQWIWLTPTRLLITHADRTPIVFDTDAQTEEEVSAFRYPTPPERNAGLN